MAACAPSVVSSAVRMVTTISPILFSVFFVVSFIRLTPSRLTPLPPNPVGIGVMPPLIGHGWPKGNPLKALFAFKEGES